MGEDELHKQRYVMNEEIAEVVFVGTKTPLRDLYVALSTNESLEGFCSRTGVDREAAVMALRMASANMPEAAINSEAWREKIASWRTEAENNLKKYEGGMGQALLLPTLFLILAGVFLTIVVAFLVGRQ